jgi:NAD(P) transhydrogenase subunit alpha
MVVGVPKESFPGERRVALVPAVIPTLLKAGLEVVVEAGAGIEAGYPDADYVAKGATILPGRADVFRTAVVITQVLGVGSNDRTGEADLPFFRPDQHLIGFLRPFGNIETLQKQTSS